MEEDTVVKGIKIERERERVERREITDSVDGSEDVNRTMTKG